MLSNLAPQEPTEGLAIPYARDIVPGVLRVQSNRRKIPGFALSSTPLVEAESLPKSPPLLVNYLVNPRLNRGIRAAGKAYVSRSNHETSIQIPFGGLTSLSCLYRHDSTAPTIEVNRFYHAAARLTVGNVHSAGWLMRDLCNIHLLLNGYSLLHAAAIQNDKSSLVTVGLSNTGKSTTVFDLTINGPCRLFGDDLVVTDGKKLFACPFTGTNVSPSQLPGTRHRIAHWCNRAIPFFEYFGPSGALAVGDYVGQDKIATPSAATHVLFLRRSEKNRTVHLKKNRAVGLLQASNRTEFTFMNSALFSGNDYLNDLSSIDTSLASEHEIFARLVANTHCFLVEGDMPYFRAVAGKMLSPTDNDTK